LLLSKRASSAAKEGVLPRLDDMFGPGGQRHLEMQLGDAYTVRVESLRDLIEVYDREVTILERTIHHELGDDRGYQAIRALHGVGRTMAAIFVAEIGDVSRFRSPEALCSWAGLAPWHRESHTKVTRGGITKMGCRLVRWAALEAIVRYHGGGWLARDFHRIAERRGTNKPAWRWPANCSRSSTAACATARSAACATTEPWRRDSSDTITGELADRHGSQPAGAAVEVIEPP
jgi:transposase